MTHYLISPETLADMLSDAFVDIREYVFEDVAAMKIVDHVYGALVADEDAPVIYSGRALRGLFNGLSDWIRSCVRNGQVLGTVRDILIRRLTDPFYLDQHL